MQDIVREKWGVAFGGGGSKGCAHIAFVKYFQENDYYPDAISGNSIGSFIAAMFAFGLSHQEIRETFLELKPFKISYLKPTNLGLMQNSSLKSILLNHFDKDTKIEDAKIPLGIHTTDIETGMPHPLYEGNLINAVISSCCVPGIYIPPYTEDKILVDGGLTENVPISLLRKFGVQKTVAINLNGQTKYTRPKNVMSVVANSLDIAIDHITKNQLKEADLVFNLDLSSYNRFVIEKVDEIIDYSYQQCIEKFH